MVQKADRARIKALLTEAITVLCKNGLGYKYSCAVEGLLGITLDDEEVFLVNINENIAGATKRPSPEPEVAKAGTDSPAGGSPSTTPRRRRRRSNSGNMDRASPAKRANYGGGDEQQAGRQQEGSDVIVIKEEVSQEEFSDFYGDTGDGQDDSTNQYAMQQHQAQADQYGAGCSQWDTSQTQSGQSDWPAFTPTQQQQHAISQAASSAMLSPSQVPSTALALGHPASNLRSAAARDMLTQHLVRPVLASTMKVISFRMNWPRQNLEASQSTWDEIIRLRAGIDELVLNIPVASFFVSGISASSSQIKDKKSKVDYKIVPSISYWMATCDHSFDMRELFSSMHNNPYGAGLKLQLQPYQQSEEHLCNAVFLTVKDNLEGCVRQLVDRSSLNMHSVNEGDVVSQEPIVKVFVKDQKFSDMIDNLVTKLDSVQFSVAVCKS